MANIMVTQRCNLHCPYCFANEFVGRSNADMTNENFVRALEFALASGETQVGLIGGEPTVHRSFEVFLDQMIQEERVEQCTIYTNGILLDRYLKRVLHPKFKLLINCNSPAAMGEAAYTKMRNNIGTLCGEYFMSDRITLGINLYGCDFEYDYMLDLLLQNGLKTVRTSISVPGKDAIEAGSNLDYFLQMKPRVLEFYHELIENGIMPFYDCNAMPRCVFTPLEWNSLQRCVEKAGLEDINLFSGTATCEPVIDILPDLNLIRCFALSEYGKAHLGCFADLDDAKAYFYNVFDSLAYRISNTERCSICYERMTMKCSGGCYAFKAQEMMGYAPVSAAWQPGITLPSDIVQNVISPVMVDK